MDTKAIARTVGEDRSCLSLYSHDTKMIVLVRPRMTGDASTAYPLAERAPMKFSINDASPEDMYARALQKKSIHEGLIYNQGDGFPKNARESFQAKFEMKDAQGRFMGRNRNGEKVTPVVTGPDGPFAEWLKARAVPQKLSAYFYQCALGQNTPQTSRHHGVVYQNAARMS